METAIVLLLFVILLLLVISGLVFSIYIMFLRAIARGRLSEGPPEEQSGGGGNPKPPDEVDNQIILAITELVGMLVDKTTLVQSEGDKIIGKLPKSTK